MKERPILFSGPMVRALLDGRKTQTRRVVKPQPVDIGMDDLMVWSMGRGNNIRGPESWKIGTDATRWMVRYCPYGVPGDRLWVRETFTADFAWPTDDGFEVRRWEQMPAAFRSEKAAASVYYFADRVKCHPRLASDLEVVPREQQPRDDEWEAMRGRPSIHMPRWASRLTLELTGVRVERLQDISGADALAEGVQIPVSAPGRPLLRMSSRVPFGAVSPKHPREWGWEEYARFEFLHLFYDINKRAPVDANPWVWCLTFRRLEAGA